MCVCVYVCAHTQVYADNGAVHKHSACVSSCVCVCVCLCVCPVLGRSGYRTSQRRCPRHTGHHPPHQASQGAGRTRHRRPSPRSDRGTQGSAPHRQRRQQPSHLSYDNEHRGEWYDRCCSCGSCEARDCVSTRAITTAGCWQHDRVYATQPRVHPGVWLDSSVYVLLVTASLRALVCRSGVARMGAFIQTIQVLETLLHSSIV